MYHDITWYHVTTAHAENIIWCTSHYGHLKTIYLSLPRDYVYGLIYSNHITFVYRNLGTEEVATEIEREACLRRSVSQYIYIYTKKLKRQNGYQVLESIIWYHGYIFKTGYEKNKIKKRTNIFSVLHWKR